jgi:membrane protein YqaA with SNARE-associated domain
MVLLFYFMVFVASLLVDVIPLVGPPAWMAMVFFQVKYHLNIWIVLVVGVLGSALGRYIYSWYIPKLSNRFLKKEKNADLEFIGSRLAHNTWKIQLFVVLYTLMPLPSTPLFTASGMARIKTLHIIPGFLIGKFISDALMVHAGNYVAENFDDFLKGMLSTKSIIGTIAVLIIVMVFLFIDWRKLLQQKKLRLNFRIFK